MVFTEENGYYEIDCRKAVWATDEHHKLYHDHTATMLSDVDWIIETRDKVLFVEYKNGNVYSSNQFSIFLKCLRTGEYILRKQGRIKWV